MVNRVFQSTLNASTQDPIFVEQTFQSQQDEVYRQQLLLYFEKNGYFLRKIRSNFSPMAITSIT